MPNSADLLPRITTAYFCHLPDAAHGKTLLAANSGGSWVQHPSYVPWPQKIGREEENLGNIFVAEELPTTVHLGVRLIGYGRGSRLLKFVLFADGDAAASLFEYQTKVQFTPAQYADLPGVVALRIAVRNVEVAYAGLYWLGIAIGDGAATYLPLYVRQYSR